MFSFLFKNRNLEIFRNSHSGKSVYILGNGPSLKNINLDLLKDKTTIAMNRIDLIFNKSDWRPTYYLFFSTNIRNKIWGDDWKKSVLSSLNENSITSFVYNKFKGDVLSQIHNKSKIYWVKKVTETKPSQAGVVDQKSFSTDISKRIDKSGTSMNIALQLAYFMDFSEIIIIGADLGWTKDHGSKSDPNHFDKSYRANIPNPKKANLQMRNIHKLSLKYFNKNKPHVKIYNGSSESYLDVYPFIDINEKLKNNKIIFQNERVPFVNDFWKNLK